MLQIRMTVLFSVLLFEITSTLTSGITTCIIQCLLHESSQKLIYFQEPEVSAIHYEGEICIIYSTMWRSVWDLHNRGPKIRG